MARRAPAKKRRGRRGRRLGRWRRLVAVGIAAAFVAGAAVLLLARATRPPDSQPFRFPPGAAAVTPTAEIEAAERARLEALLTGLAETPSSASRADR